MVQLQSCYFCGAVGDSLQEYELVPPRLTSADRSRSAVLCSACHEKLRRVLEPLVEASAESASSSAGKSAPPSAGSTVTSTQEVTFESGRADDSSADGDDVRVDDENGDGSDVDGGADGSDTDADSDATADGSDDAEASGTSEEATVEADADATGDDETSAPSDVPDEYYKALRLLQNREFPMERAAVTTLVTGAYDVSVAECERIIETAVERGVLVERGSTLALGRD